MESQRLSLNIDEDIAETEKLLTVVTRPIVRDRLTQLLSSLQQVHGLTRYYSCTNSQLCHLASIPGGFSLTLADTA